MRIKHYPGRAMDANLSMDKHNSMGMLYEANWLNANERIQQPSTSLNYSKSSVNVSALGKYQNQLEEIKAYEAETKDASITRTIRELNGYKPSTMRKKTRKQYHEWDDYKEELPSKMFENQQYHSTEILAKSKKDKLKRSNTTVIVKQPTSSLIVDSHYIDPNWTIADRSSHHQRPRLPVHEKHPSKYLNMFSISEFNDSNNNQRNRMASQQEYFHNGHSGHHNDRNSRIIQNDRSNRNSRSTQSESNYRLPKDDKLLHEYETIDFSSFDSDLAPINGKNTLRASNDRMNCYQTSNLLCAQLYNQNNEKLNEASLKHLANQKLATPSLENYHNQNIMINPLARNKSVKINHFDTIKPAKIDKFDKFDKIKVEKVEKIEKLDKKKEEEPKSPKKDKKGMSFSRIFYNTISAGSKFPRVFLGKNKNQRPKLDLQEVKEIEEEPRVFKNPLSSINSSSSSSPVTLSTLSSASSSSNSSPTSKNKVTVNSVNGFNTIKRKQGSASSSDSDSFLIPRPRLIVPVHTYARKRRTGNLNSENCDNLEDPISQGKPNQIIFFLVAH